ncbi:hypothetical protein BC833DRAFT_561711 [Globomyces pollinis-pini]|nr:hypothetical protein BC833DRAFT_561711 [Globomyces pollinis-pini]
MSEFEDDSEIKDESFHFNYQCTYPIYIIFERNNLTFRDSILTSHRMWETQPKIEEMVELKTTYKPYDAIIKFFDIQNEILVIRFFTLSELNSIVRVVLTIISKYIADGIFNCQKSIFTYFTLSDPNYGDTQIFFVTTTDFVKPVIPFTIRDVNAKLQELRTAWNFHRFSHQDLLFIYFSIPTKIPLQSV